MYLRYGDAPLVAHGLAGGSFPSVYDCWSAQAGENICAVTNPTGGPWYLMLEGVTFYSVTLEVTTLAKK
jgi:hypothetical protein